MKNLLTIDTIIDKVIRDTQDMFTVDRNAFGNWVAEAIEQIGGHSQYEYNTYVAMTDNHGQVIMPCGVHKIQSVVSSSGSVYSSANRVATGCSNTYVYKAPYLRVGNFDTLAISYIAIPLDEDGYPLIPDHIAYVEACFRYVIYKLMYKKFLNGDIAGSTYSKLEQDWRGYARGAKGVSNMPDKDAQERIRLMRGKLIPHVNAYYNNFATVYTEQLPNY